MSRKRILLVGPLAALGLFPLWVVLAPKPTRGAESRIISPLIVKMERDTGRHYYAPTWLPDDGRVGWREAVQGEHRLLQDYQRPDGTVLLIVAQEPRTPERDAYHERVFGKFQASADINGHRGYFITGSSGERRLFWNQDDMAIILSAASLDDDNIVRVARRMR